MGKRKNTPASSGSDGKDRILATLFPPKPNISGAMNLIERINLSAGAIAGLADTLHELEAAKGDSQDGLLDWYDGAGGYHSGAVQTAISLLANRISDDVLNIAQCLEPETEEHLHG